MSEDIYENLARHLDDLPGGFPSTGSGVEMRILRRLFTPEEAELALHLTLIPEESRVIARRAGIARDEADRCLKEMAGKGLVYSLKKEGGLLLYVATQMLIGIWEFHVNDLDPELIRDMDEYLPILLDNDTWSKVPQMRTIPVGRSITAQLKVFPYENAEELVRGQKKAVVAPCICRTERRMVGEGCDRPVETCLSFGTAADYYERNGLGRVIDHEEVLEILKKAEQAGLVLQPGNFRELLFICCCCGCCCALLRNIKRHPRPATLISTPFKAALNPETCKGCGTCVDRCQMEAVKLVDDKIDLNVDRCIGCGLCVTTCPTGSLTLVRKPESKQHEVPGYMMNTAYKLGRVRGKLGAGNIAMMHLKSKVDRILAR
ncbi:MAG: 4Fe-4S binding protein [Deltaproteobacteria bacterium]|nr:4Fe-4S binding protein [Deltaproteobacteria bacterium]